MKISGMVLSGVSSGYSMKHSNNGCSGVYWKIKMRLAGG